ncbi:C39 family peptidase [Pelagibius litoralis]|uniref:C39 family peptidase n=1 Tax=Pelagibius litoralis TaxID=374515 RepID=UPI0019812F71|nr:C39 family peptidase [Pelagibius litoralis]
MSNKAAAVFFAAAVTLSAMAPFSSARAADARFVSAGGMSFNLKVQSIKERKWHSVVRQERDFSCGSAAVATLLSYHYGRPTEEVEVFDAMFAVGDRQKIMAQGFSLLDMKRFLDARGYTADGFRVSLDKLAEVGVPAIVLLDLYGYKHFVVIKGVTAEHVLVGDPSRGIQRYKRTDFGKLLANDIVFVVRTQVEIAKANFNLVDDWSAHPSAPFGPAVSQSSLANITIYLPGTGTR